MSFVLADASTVQSPCSLASIVRHNDFSREGVKTVTSRTLTEVADERHGVQELLQTCLEFRGKSKKCDKQLTHIVRVSISDQI